MMKLRGQTVQAKTASSDTDKQGIGTVRGKLCGIDRILLLPYGCSTYYVWLYLLASV
ncbi:MAG TPA: hypothetical protein VEG25_05420 [Burkholderiales bacterium]|nr:hypothetical protein [Burkholderiales bacterium]